MPKRSYYCKDCNKVYKKIVENPEPSFFCPKCGELTSLKFGTISTVVKEVIDNGFQPKKVEQYANAGDLYKEHAHDANKKKNENDL